MIMALEGGEGSASRLSCSLPPGKTRYPLYRRLGGPQGWSGQVRKISLPLGFEPRTVQPVASRYTDYATRPTLTEVYTSNCLLVHSENVTLSAIVTSSQEWAFPIIIDQVTGFSSEHSAVNHLHNTLPFGVLFRLFLFNEVSRPALGPT